MKLRSGAWMLIVILFALLLPAPAPDGEGMPFLWGATAKAQGYDCAAQLEVSPEECAVLVAFYNSTNGAAWSNQTDWLATTSPCTWFGILCESDHFISISLPDNGLSGTLPAELGSLPSLQSLSVYSNSVSGEIPPALGNVTSLTYLNLSGNQFTGNIPTEFGNLTNLTDLWLNNNQLSGNIPAALGNLASLQNLILYSNQLTGDIPLELGNLSSLQTLFLSNNLLTGAIPPQLGNLSLLTSMYLNNNSLTGNIPAELGNLTGLTALRLATNQLSGSIPAGFGNLTNLTDLWLNDNLLTGPIPAQFGNLVNLQNLILYSNQLSGSIPPEFGNLSSLQVLYLAVNQLSGPIPAGLGNLSQLTSLYLDRNSLTGAIPAELGNLGNLTDLWLDENMLTGPIPPQLSNLANLRYLMLYANQLSGSIPAGLGNLSNLLFLQLGDNPLNGPIPAELGNLSQLTSLYLNNNGLTGNIPVELSNLTNLETLYLSNNQLSGSIPAELGNLSNLTELYLQANLLTGAIPAELGNLTNVQNLYLYTNQLSGNIPAQLGNLTSVQTLYLSDNQLGGTIPATLGNLANLTTLFLNDNRLIGSLPASLGNAPQLVSIDIANNLLSGALPASLTNLQLASFVFDGTGLCTPDDNADLTNWLAAIPTVSNSGLVCDQIPTPSLVAVPNAGRAGAQVRVIGDRFQPQGPYSFYLSGLATPVASITADDAGQFDIVITVPADFAPTGADVTVSARADFEPVGAVQSTKIDWLSPLALSLSPNSARPGETVTATISNLYADTVALTYADTTVAGPVAVDSGVFVLPFVVPPGGAAGTPLTVAAQNLVNDLPFGNATAAFTPQEEFVFEEQPNAQVEVENDNPPPPWQSDTNILITGSFPDIPQDMRAAVKVDVMFTDLQGRVFPLTNLPLPLNANGNFNAQIRMPSLLAGDPLPTPGEGNLIIAARLGNEVKIIQAGMPVQTGEPPFAIRVVITGTGKVDGNNVPDTPGGSLRLLYKPQGIAYADTADLESANFSEALKAAFKTAYDDQIHDAINDVVEKYFDCHPVIPQREVQPWETVWRPPDVYKLIADQQIMPVVQMPNLIKQLNVGPIAAGTQPDAVANPDALVEVRFIYVNVDATEVKDGTTAPNGYGPPELIQEKRKVAFGALYAVIPSTGAVYLVKGFDANNVLATISFERQPAGPVIVALRPYPAAALPRLQFDVSVPGLNVLDIAYVQDPNGFGKLPVRIFGELYSFKDFPPPLSFEEDDGLEIHTIVNDGYAGVQVPLSAVKMTLYPNRTGAGIPLRVTQQNYGSDPCKSVPRVRFVGTIDDGGRALPPGHHLIVVEINDGIDKLDRRIELSYQPWPSYFDDAGLKSRRVVWSPAKVEISTARFNSQDNTKVPGDLQIDAPSGPNPKALHVDNESGLDNRILQTLTPSGPGAVRQTTNSQAQAWNTQLSQGVNGASAAAFPSLASFATTFDINANRPVIPCDKNNPYEYCIGPKTFGVPEKEMLLFPPILWGIPGLVDVKIAGTLAYLAGVDISGKATAGIPPEVTMQVWPYAQVRVAIDVAGEILGGLIGRLGLNTSGNVHADVPVLFTTAGKNAANACFRWFVHVRFYVEAGCIPFTDICAYEDTIAEDDILDGRTPDSPFCNAQGAQASIAASPLDDLPPSGHPAIASDGIHMLAIWNTTANELVYSHFDGNAWSPPLAIDTGRIAERAAVAYFDTNRAVAVWNGTTLTQPGAGQSLDNVLAAQVLEYSVWDGTSWSEPARLAPQSKGDGGAVLASCPAGAAGCPISGEVTAAWTHIEDGTFSDHHLRVYTANFFDGAWQAPQAADPASTSLDTAPMITYAAGQPVVGWVRDADSSFATTNDRRIALLNLFVGGVDLPQALPTDVVAGTLAADDQGQLILAYTRAADGALFTNHHQIVAAKQSCAAGCTWTAMTLVDTNGRALQGEHPVLTLDSQNRATITYRATGFGPDAQGNMVYASDALGITEGSGELAQLELNSQFTAANPRALTQDAVLDWEPAAAYNAGLNQIVALSVRGPATGMAAASVAEAGQALDDSLVFVASDRQPDFAIETVEPSYPTPTATLPSEVSVTVANLGVTAIGDDLQLEVAAAWDVPPQAAEQVSTASLNALAGGAASTLTLPVPPVSGAPEAEHTLYVTVNGKPAIAESDFANNQAQLTLSGVVAPEQVYVTANPLDGLFYVSWDAPERTGPVAGYRVYRRTGQGAWQPVGSSFGTTWADVNASFDTNYEYAVSAYGASGFESDRSQSMKATMSALPEADDWILFLPKLDKAQ